MKLKKKQSQVSGKKLIKCVVIREEWILFTMIQLTGNGPSYKNEIRVRIRITIKKPPIGYPLSVSWEQKI